MKTNAWAAAALTAMVSATVHAQPEPSAARRVWLELRPWTCARELPALAREVELACDALGAGCEVAVSEGEATERATVFCDANSHSAESVRLSGVGESETLFVTLMGDREQRLRSAAMWIARTHVEVELAEKSHAPEQPAECARLGTETPPRSPVAMDPLEDPYFDSGRAKRRTSWAALVQSRGGIAFSAFTGVNNNPAAGDLWGGGGSGVEGVRGEIAVPLRHAFYWGPSASYLAVYKGPTPTPWGNDGWNGPALSRGVLFGARAGWGAPYDDFWVGASIEVGGGATWGVGDWSRFPVANDFGQPPPPRSTPGSAATAFARAAFNVQIPVKVSPVRPFFTLAGIHFTNELGWSAQMADFEAGLAWQAF